MKRDKERLNARLEIAYEMCEDEGTEYMLQVLADTVMCYNLGHGTKFDPHEYAMNWLQNV